MSTVEAAASLFGPEEPESDPFATLGTEEDTTTTSNTNDLFLGQENTPPLDFFNASSDNPPLSHSSEALRFEPPYGSGFHLQDPSQTTYNQTQEWYGERGQLRAQEQSSPETIPVAQDYAAVPSYPAPSNLYNAYASVSNYTSPSRLDAANTASHSRSPYDIYNPSVQASSTHHNSATSSQSSYEPYTPTTSAFQSGLPPSYSSASPYIAKATVAPIPPPPTLAAPLNRPTTLNAYDPPFPTSSKPARRGASTRLGQPSSVMGQTYPAVVPPPTTVAGPYPSSSNVQEVAYTNNPGVYGTSHPTDRDKWKHSYDNIVSDGQKGHEGGNGPPVVDFFRKENEASRTSYQSGYGLAIHHDPAVLQTTRPGDAHVLSTSPHPAYQSGSRIDSFGDNGFEPQKMNHSDHPLDPPLLAIDMYASSHISPGSLGSQSPSSISREAVSPGRAFDQSAQSENHALGLGEELVPSGHVSVSKVLAVDAHDPKYVDGLERTSSPTSLSNHSRDGSQGSDSSASAKRTMQLTNSYERKPISELEKDAFPGLNSPSSGEPRNTSNGQVNGTRDSHPYLMTAEKGGERAPSPGSPPLHSWNTSNGSMPPDQYAPDMIRNAHNPPLNAGMSSPASTFTWHDTQTTSSVGGKDRIGAPRGLSLSNGSAFSVSAGDPYAPSQHNRHSITEIPGYGSYSSSHNPYGHEVGLHKNLPPVYDQSGGQDLLAHRTQPLYAPSPSLLGSNDPLGRTAARVPVFSFGFGGKLVTCFHGSSVLNTGFDVALSSRKSMDIHIRVLNMIIPESALDTSTALFPGPLFSDPGTPTTSLVRTGSFAQIKAKKARLLKYLDERTAEISQGIGYLHPASGDRRKAEGKFVLVRLLKAMIENDGRLSGTPQIDIAVRAALIPWLNVSTQNNSNTVSSHGFSSPVDAHASDSSSYPNLGLSPPDRAEAPIAITTLRPSNLDKIQEFLLRGERQKAYHYALDERLWAHAMIIASSIDKEAWKEVVGEFVKNELGTKGNASRSTAYMRSAPVGDPSTQLNGRESLRVAYSLFSGQGATAVQELIPHNVLSRATVSHVTPMTPNFPSLPVNVPVESLSRWAETAAMILTNPMTAESSAALTTLGDYLASNQWTEAAHACYLLAPQTSPIGGFVNPSTRIVLLGSHSPQVSPGFHKDSDNIIFTEIVEFALSLATPAKSQEAFNGLPHLQVYKLIRATSLAEMGQIQLANRYCEAITASLSRTSPYFTKTFVEELKGLSDRIVGAPQIDKSGSWIGGKMSKPSLDSIGTWLEGRFTKLIAGDGETDGTPPPMDESTRGQPFSGPFSHYSAISSATPSASPSPQPSIVDLNFPPRRSGSAMAYPLINNSHAPIDRASSAIDYVRRRPSPAPRILSANAVTSNFSQSASFGQTVNDYTPTGESGFNTQTPRPLDQKEETGGNQDVAWWGSSYAQDYSAQTPTATTFMRAQDPNSSESSSGFISLMDEASILVAPAHIHSQHSHEQEDEEDLGFGNSRNKKPSQDTSEASQSPPMTVNTEPVKVAPQGPEGEGASSGSWISRWWRKGDANAPGPIKASLGEETSFVYDKELKRWVNKKGGGTEPPKSAHPPPPPSRSQTTSPGRSHPNGTSVGPPPARSASAIDLSTSPPSKSNVRARSNLVPKLESESVPTSSTPPPQARPRSQVAKRNIRSRYVDVFQEGAQ